MAEIHQDLLDELLPFILNLGLLSLCCMVLFTSVILGGIPRGSPKRNAISGLIFGLIAALVVLVPVHTDIGASFDSRAAPIVLAGYFAGPIGGLIAACIGGLARYEVGGATVIGGVVSFFLYAAAGCVFLRLQTRLPAAWRDKRLLRTLLLGIFATICALPAFFIGLPAERGIAILTAFGPTFVVNNLAAITLMGMTIDLMFDYEQRVRQKDLDLISSQHARGAARMGSWRYDFAEDRLEWDQIEREIFGRPDAPSVITLKEFRGPIVDELRDGINDAFQVNRRLSNAYTRPVRIRWPSGEIRHIRGFVTFHGGTKENPEFAAGLNWDETEEYRLREALALTQAATDVASCGIVIAEAHGHYPIIQVNEAAENMTGYTAEELVGSNCSILNIGIEDQPQLDVLRDALHKKLACSVTLRNRRKNGELYWNKLSISPIRNDGGEVTHFVGIKEDISEHYERQELLGETLSKLTIGCVVADNRGRISLFNTEAERMFGYKADEVIGENISMLMPDRIAREHDSYLSNYLETGKARIIGFGRELEGRRKDGTYFPMHLGISETQVGGELRFIGSITDLTEYRQLEAQLMRAQRMEAIGQLTGGIAHDFNNLMGTILGNAELLQDSLDPNSEERQLIDRILRAVDQGSAQTERLLAFSRQKNIVNRVVSIPEIVDGMGPILRRALGDAVDLDITYGSNIWHCMLDPDQFEAALLNLALNARDAMPDGGLLTIEIRNTAQTEPDMERVLPPGSYVSVSVRDTGTGIDPEDLEKVFEPFFTTKEVGKGSGLGLSMVYGFTRSSNGNIRVASTPGEGTTFTLMFPRTEVSEPVGSTDPQSRIIEHTPGIRTLVVEDDPEILRIAVRTLIDAGHEVVAAATGPEALEILDSQPPFDLLFTDVVLRGGMNGIKLANEAKAKYPGLRTLYASGYADDVIEHEKPPGDLEMLHKPYRRNQLLEAVSQILTEGAPANTGNHTDGSGI